MTRKKRSGLYHGYSVGKGGKKHYDSDALRNDLLGEYSVIITMVIIITFNMMRTVTMMTLMKFQWSPVKQPSKWTFASGWSCPSTTMGPHLKGWPMNTTIAIAKVY